MAIISYTLNFMGYLDIQNKQAILLIELRNFMFDSIYQLSVLSCFYHFYLHWEHQYYYLLVFFKKNSDLIKLLAFLFYFFSFFLVERRVEMEGVKINSSFMQTNKNTLLIHGRENRNFKNLFLFQLAYCCEKWIS